jgi:hypothetical protein
MILSDNFRSVKTLLTSFRLDWTKNAVAAEYVTHRTNPIQSTSSWSFDIASFKVPQQKIVGYVETYTEL